MSHQPIDEDIPKSWKLYLDRLKNLLSFDITKTLKCQYKTDTGKDE